MSDYMSMSPSAFSNQIMFGDNAALRNMPGPAPHMADFGGNFDAYNQANLGHIGNSLNYSSAVNALNSQRSMDEGANFWANSRATNDAAYNRAVEFAMLNSSTSRKMPTGYYSPQQGRSPFSGVSLQPQPRYSGGGIGSDMRFGGQNRILSPFSGGGIGSDMRFGGQNRNALADIMSSRGGIGSDMRFGGQNNFLPGGIPAGNVSRARLPPAGRGDPYFMLSDAGGFNPSRMGTGGIGSDARFGDQNRFARSPQLDSALDAVTPDRFGRFGGSGSSPFQMPPFNDPRTATRYSGGGIGSDARFGGQDRPSLFAGGGIGSDARFGGQNASPTRFASPGMSPFGQLPGSSLFERFRGGQPSPMRSDFTGMPPKDPSQFAGGSRFSLPAPWTSPATGHNRGPALGPPSPSLWQTDPWIGGGLGRPGTQGYSPSGRYPALIGAPNDAYGNPFMSNNAPPYSIGAGRFGGGTGIGGLGQGTAFQPIPTFRR